jgi:hypothetical protein
MFTILSYCNTQEKKEHLLNLITNLKVKFPEREILVYSHYQNLEPEYYKGANYYIFDFSNPIVNKLLIDWVSVYHQSKVFYRMGPDYGFAVIQMIKRSCLFLLNMDIEETVILNYDCSVDDLDSIDQLRTNEDEIGSFFFWCENRKNSPGSPLGLTFMNLKISAMGRGFFESLTYERYMSFPIDFIPEDIFGCFVEESFKGRWSLITHKITPTISTSNRELPDGHYLLDYFSTILPTRNNFEGNKEKCLAIWNCKIKIEKITINIDGNEYTMHNEIEGDYSELAFFSHLPRGIEIEKIILLTVNSEGIEPYIIEGLDENYWEYNYHEK